MEQRTLGKTGLKLAVLSFGCGAVGGLMTKGAAATAEAILTNTLDRPRPMCGECISIVMTIPRR